MLMLSLLGLTFGAGLVFSLTGIGADDFQISPATSTASVEFFTNGTVVGTGNFTSGTWNWVTPTSALIGNDYEIEAHLDSGTTPSGDLLDTWLALSSSRSWTVTKSIGTGTNETILRIKIRRVSDSVEVAEGYITMTATRET